jgi:hypothetical protein
MFAAESLRDWLGHTVIDPEGHKIGTLEAVYVDTASDQPCFITVKVGMMSRHRMVFVPVAGATVSPKAVRVQYPKKVVQNAPATDTDGELAATAEPGCSRTTTLTTAAGPSGDSPAAKRPPGSTGREVPLAAAPRGSTVC